MKLKFKLSNTQKFVLDVNPISYGELKSTVLAYIFSTYEKDLKYIELSLNGKDPLIGSDDSPISSLGIVPGDILTILHSADSKVKSSGHSSCSASVETSVSMPSNAVACGSLSTPCGSVQRGGETHSDTNFQHLLDAFSEYEPASQDQVMIMLVHLAMVENGFQLADDQPPLNIAWKNVVTCIKYVNPELGDFACTLVITTIGETKEIFANFVGQASQISMKVNINNHVKAEEPFTASCVKDHKKFSFYFKNQLICPLQLAAYDILGVSAHWHITGLPREILIRIASFLNVKAIVSFGMTCKKLHSSMDDKKIWFHLFKKDFPKIAHKSDTLTGSDWKAKYESAYIDKKNSEHHKNRYFEHSVPPELIPPPNFPDPHHPFMPEPGNPFPFTGPVPLNPFRDPDGPYFRDDQPFPGLPQPFPITRPRRPRGPRIQYL